jgi:competence protein ComEC
MMSVVIGGWALRRPGDLLNSLAASAFLILLWEPRQLFQASFQLSFFVVLSLALLMPPLTRRLDDWLAPDPLLPAALAPGWRRWLGGPLRHVSLAAATSLAACLGSFPLIAHYFHLVTPVSLAANLVVVPLSSLALMSNLGGLACAPWLPWAAELFNHSAWLWMSWMAAVSEWAARLPGAWFYVRGPGWVGFVLYYAAVGGCFSGWLLAPPRRKWGLAALGLLAVVAAGWAADVGRPTVLTLLAPPSGTCLYADRPGRARDLLIDAGSESAARWVVLPFLQGQGVNRLSHLLVTHGDQAHAGGARLVRDAFRAEAIHTSPIRSTSRGYRYLWEELEQDPGRWQKVQAGDAPAGWQVLHPAARDRWPRGDDNAVVLAATLEGVRVLLLSDLGEAGQEALRGRSPDLRADIVVTGLPRQGEPLRDELLRAVRPALIVVTDAAYPAAERARPALRERLERGGVPVLCLTETGSLTLRFEAGAWEARAMDGRRWRGRPGENGR